MASTVRKQRRCVVAFILFALILTHSESPAHGMMSITIRTGLPPSVKPFWKHLHRYTRRHASLRLWVRLNPMKREVWVNHHSLTLETSQCNVQETVIMHPWAESIFKGKDSIQIWEQWRKSRNCGQQVGIGNGGKDWRFWRHRWPEFNHKAPCSPIQGSNFQAWWCDWLWG